MLPLILLQLSKAYSNFAILIDMNDFRFRRGMRVYCAGIGGIGLSGLAQILHGYGCHVEGSDITDSSITTLLKQKGIPVTTQHQASTLPRKVDVVIFSSALPEHHLLRQEAATRKIHMMSYFEAVGKLMREFATSIAISGTHGKTTTTALIASLLVYAGMDPTVIVGSITPDFGSNARIGKKRGVFVVEACEHQAHMLHLYPKIIVLTNIEEDHLDYYRDLDHIVATFQKYINHLPSDGVLVKNADDAESRELGTDARIVTYGIQRAADVRGRSIHRIGTTQQFQCDGMTYTLHIPGKFNVANALAAIAVARVFDIPENIVQQTLDHFHGVWRRFQMMGEYRSTTVISDYAHHPTAITETILAAHQFFPKRRLIVVFQPHQRSRTKKLFKKFAHAFTGADFVILQEIYDVAGREDDRGDSVSSRDLAAAIEKNGKYALFSPNARLTRQSLDEMIEPNDVVLVMGAGDIYHLAEELVQTP